MRNPQRDSAGELTWVGAEPPQLAYASDVQVSADLSNDPLLTALADAEVDNEPYPDEQRAVARSGWEEYSRGETVPWEQVR